MNAFITRHNGFIQHLLEKADIPSLRLKQAMQYSLFPGGKRLRPLLVYLCGEIVAVDLDCLDILGASIELIHTYSLIHDDLPAMDNDDFRRGKPSCHKTFDEATAILTGDGLQTLAFQTLITELPKFIGNEKTLAVMKILALAAGPSGMVSGQALDLSELAKSTLNLEELIQIHQLKTGNLFNACLDMILAAVDPEKTIKTSLSHFGEYFGLAYQLQDDYLDAYASPQILGKDRASDQANQKRTFAYYFTQKALLQEIETYYQSAVSALAPLGKKGIKLLNFVGEVMKVIP